MESTRPDLPRIGANSRGIVQEKERILVVEPNDLILGLLECWLREAGYVVVVETLRGLPRAVGEGGAPQLVIIDATTPQNAEKVIRLVKEEHAGPILLLSASLIRDTNSSNSVARQFGVRRALQKPFTRGELLTAVDEAIDSH